MISNRMHDIQKEKLKKFAKIRRRIMEKISKNEATDELLKEIIKCAKGKLKRELTVLIKSEENWESKMEIVNLLQIDREEGNEVWKTLDENIRRQ